MQIGRFALLLALLVPACGVASESSDEDSSGEDLTKKVAPKTLFSGSPNDRQIASDAHFVYWTEGSANEVRKVALSGGTPTVLWKGHGADSPESILLDDGFVYFTVGGRVLRVSSVGGTAQELARQTRDLPIYLATDHDYVYWAGQTDWAIDYEAYIRRVKKTGGAIQTVYTGHKGIETFLVSHGYVYFAGSDFEVTMNSPFRLMRIPVTGGTPEQLFKSDGMIRAMTADATSLFFAAAGSKWTIESLPLGGGTPTKLLEMPLGMQNEPSVLAAGNDSVFWVSAGTFDFSHSPPDNHDAHVYRAKKSGGPRVTVASNIDSPEALTVGGDCATWASSTSVQTTCH